MRFSVTALLLSFCVLCQAAATSAAPEALRIKRGTDAASGEETKPITSDGKKPLTGGVHFTSVPLVDPNEFGSAKIDGNVNEWSGQGGAANPLGGSLNAAGAPLNGSLNAPQRKIPGGLSGAELKLVGSCDVVVMQDRSSSMGEKEYFPGFPDKLSRWQWCNGQVLDLTRQTMAAADWAITLVLFSSRYETFNHVAMSQIPSIFARQNGIYVGTKLAEPLASQLGPYFSRRQSGNKRPLIVLVVTDGKPDDDELLRELIAETTRRMQSPNEIHISFLQVGDDSEGREKLRKLDDGLMAQGARFDIVDVVPFTQVVQLGLTRSLIGVIKRDTTMLTSEGHR